MPPSSPSPLVVYLDPLPFLQEALEVLVAQFLMAQVSGMLSGWIASGRSQNTVPIVSTQVAIKGIVRYSTRAQFLVEQLVTRCSREHTLSAVGPDAQVEQHIDR